MTYDALEVIARESDLLRAAAQQDLTRTVPSCPDWTLDDLTYHLAGVQRFHALHLPRGLETRPTEHPADLADDGDLMTWSQDATRDLVAVLEALDPDAPAWNFTGAPRTVAFWHRRMAMEASVHRWDAQATPATQDVQREAVGFDPEVALDGIDEALTVLPRQTATGVVRVVADDREWTVDLSGGTQKTPDAVLSGPASGVFLWLWGRVPLSSDLVVEGDESLVAALRTDQPRERS